MFFIGLCRCGKVREEKLNDRQVRLPVNFDVMLIMFDHLTGAHKRGRIEPCYNRCEQDEGGDEDGNQLKHMENYGDSVKKMNSSSLESRKNFLNFAP